MALRVNQLVGFGRRPLIVVAGGGITVVGSTSTTSTSVAVPGTHQSGDFIGVISLNMGNGTIPALLTGGTDILNSAFNSSNNAGRSHWRYATSSSDTIAGLTSGPRHHVLVLRGTHATVPIGDFDSAAGNSASATIDGLTLAAATSFVFVGIGSETAVTTPSLPSGMTSIAAAAGYRSSYQGPIGTFSSNSSTVANNRWVTMNFEVLAA